MGRPGTFTRCSQNHLATPSEPKWVKARQKKPRDPSRFTAKFQRITHIPQGQTQTTRRKKNQMQLEGVRISWASKDKVNTGCESCQWVGKGAVQASPRRGLARGVPNGTIMGGNRKKNQVTHQSSKPKPGKADTLGKHTQKQKTSICIFQGDLFGHLRDTHPIPSYQWRPKFGLGRKMNPSHANKPGS